ncbi:porin family protein [Aliifodinibius salicampi]|uniref:Porin family protein n=1 Tax=Fodinibius salicampi TaxID=1920655 RepID=A0ABT3Q245_9BACT|nr:outer membrane beta-barrel protein [Fodinibius salicampi]MCW9714197.1 porin family protein [Fodinibius salicampi]
MSTNKHNPEDPIEEFFQKKVQEFDISYREKDWMKLEKKLDMAARKRSLEKKRRWLIAASLLLFALLGYFTYQNYVSIDEINEQLSEQTEQQQDQPEQSEELETLPDITSPEADDNLESDQNISGEMADESSNGDVEDNRQNIAGTRQAEQAQQEYLVSNQMSRGLNVNEVYCPECNLSSLGKKVYPKVFATVESEEGNERTENQSITSDHSENGEGMIASSRFALGFVASPDFSTVGSLSNFSDMGYKIGVAVEYRLTKNLSVSGGVIQSDVRYTAQGGDYNPNQGYGSYGNPGVLPDETFARCLILDIPINVKYNFLNFEHSRLYASTGIASYIMLNEEYDFRYDQNGEGLPQSWNKRTGTGHLMSNVGFSIGLEYDIHPRWSLRAEPYVRVPLKGVGEGNVKLYSIGSFVSLNFQLQ